MQDLVISEILEGYGDIKSLSYAVEYLLEKSNRGSITIYMFLIGKQLEERGVFNAVKESVQQHLGDNRKLTPICLENWSGINTAFRRIDRQRRLRDVIATNIHRRIPLTYEDFTPQGLPSGINYKNFYSFLGILNLYLRKSPPEDILFITDLNRNLTNKLFATMVEATYPFTQITRNGNDPIQHRESYQYKNLKFTIFVPHINTLSHSNEFFPSAALSPAIPERERQRFYNFKPPNQSFKQKIIIKAYIPEAKERNGEIVDPTNFTQDSFQKAIQSVKVRRALYILGFTEKTTILMHGATDTPDGIDTKDKVTGYHFPKVETQKPDEFLQNIYRSDLFISSGAHSAQEALSLNDNENARLGLIVYCASHHMFELARQMNALLPSFIRQHLNPISKSRVGNNNDGIINVLSNIIILAAYNKLFRYCSNPNVPVPTPKKIESVATHFPDFNQSQKNINDLCNEYQIRLRLIGKEVRKSLLPQQPY